MLFQIDAFQPLDSFLDPSAGIPQRPALPFYLLLLRLLPPGAVLPTPRAPRHRAPPPAAEGGNQRQQLSQLLTKGRSDKAPRYHMKQRAFFIQKNAVAVRSGFCACHLCHTQGPF